MTVVNMFPSWEKRREGKRELRMNEFSIAATVESFYH